MAPAAPKGSTNGDDTTVADEKRFLAGRVLVVAFEGWNDAGDAASGAVQMLKDALDVVPLAEVDPELYFDYQFNRPILSVDDDGHGSLEWPSAVLYGPTKPAGMPVGLADDAELLVSGSNAGNIFVLLGTEPSRGWKSFTAELLDAALAADVETVVLLGSMLADVPHTRPISVFVSSANSEVRGELGLERSSYEGPVGILSVFAEAAEQVGIPTVSIWASVPHYVHNATSPKAILALVDRLEELIDVTIPRGDLVDESATWEAGIDALAAEDEDMAAYIKQLEQARDTVDSPEASGEAIAREFERYLRRRGDGGPGGAGPGGPGGRGDEPWRGRD